jgi:hypothetical protein
LQVSVTEQCDEHPGGCVDLVLYESLKFQYEMLQAKGERLAAENRKLAERMF